MTTLRRISLHLDADGCIATNGRGATLCIDPDGLDGFTPVELLLAALGSCGAVDVELLMRKQRDPIEAMDVEVTAHKVETRLHDLRVTYAMTGEHDPRKVDRSLTQTSDNLCTVSRTLRSGAEVVHELG
jgi:uncharacterized OsmC-like protein